MEKDDELQVMPGQSHRDPTLSQSQMHEEFVRSVLQISAFSEDRKV